MKTAIIEGVKKVSLPEVERPVAMDDLVVVKVHSAPMCNEYKTYVSGEQVCNIGHEAAGEVIEVAGSKKVKPGDRVIVMPQYPCGSCALCASGEYIHCENLIEPLKNNVTPFGSGAYAGYIIKPDWLLIPIPDDITYDEASMACCGLGPAFAAAKTMKIQSGDTVLITGLGPVGLGAVIDSSFRGARIIGATRNDFRKNLAAQLGAQTIIDPDSANAIQQIMDITNGKGVDKIIECSGYAPYQQLAFKTVKRKGQIGFIGESDSLTINISKDLLRKGLTLHGIWHWNLNHTDEMIRLIRSSKEKISKLITHIFPMERIEEAFQLQITAQCGKIILRP